MRLSTALLLALPATTQVGATNTTLSWVPCANKDYQTADLDCATLQVPLDWNNPAGPKITLGMNRMKASDPQTRIGSLIFNPGGPGIPVAYSVLGFATNTTFYGEKLKRSFDTIGLDPRGIGLSTPIKCNNTLYNDRPSQMVSTRDEFERLVKWNKDFAESCEALSGPLVRHVDTISVARDLEAVRLALGEEKLRFLGQSYGTQIGGMYAQLFPNNIGAMVLDGVVDHSMSDYHALLSEAYGMDAVWDKFVDWCRSETTCALHGATDINAQLAKLLDQAAKSPMQAPDCAAKGCQTSVKMEDLTGAIQSFLDYQTLPEEYAGNSDTWQSFSSHLADAFKANVSAFSPGMAQDIDGTNQVGYDQPWMQQLVNCLDWTHNTKSAQDLVAQRELVSGFHLRGIAQTYAIDSMCAEWPFAVPDLPKRYTISHTSAPVLLASSFFDPETPYDQAVSVQGQIPGSILLSSETPGHTVYVRPGPAADIIEAYLIKGTMPKSVVVDH